MSSKIRRQNRDVKVVVNIIFLLLIIVIAFLLAQKLNLILKSSKYKKKNYISTKRKSLNSNYLISKFNFIKTKEDFLSKQGNPLNLNAIKYYIFKIVLTILLFIVSLYNYKLIFMSVIFAIFGFLILDLYIAINKKSRDNEICSDLLNVTDSICLQLSAHVPLKDAIKKQYENCNNKDFKKAMIVFLTKYELSELDMESSINLLKSKFDVLELNIFCGALLQYNKTENIIEILENLSGILQEKYVDKLKSTTVTKIIYITFGVIVLLINIILLVFYPLFISIGQGFNNIFR